MLEGIDAATRGRAAGEGERGRQARRERGPDRPDGGVLPRDAATRCASSSSWTSAHTNGWRLDDVVSADEIVAALDAAFGVEPVDAGYRGEVAKRWRYKDGRGEIGVIASVTQPFCGDCTRARLSAEGKLFTCLFAVRGHDLRALIRGGATDDGARDRRSRASGKPAKTATPSFAPKPRNPCRKVEMSYIGG